jgi:addiction module HigA family antidote
MKKELDNKKKKLPPIHPGEILRERLLIPRDISPQELAHALKIPKEQIKWLCEERGDITPDLAARLALYFDSTVEFWLNLQRSYEEEVAKEKTELLKDEVIPYHRTRRENGRHLRAK